MSTLPQCCARKQAKLTSARADLRRAAQRAAVRAEKGLPTGDLQRGIDATKRDIEQAQQAIEDHEAEHAEDAQ